MRRRGRASSRGVRGGPALALHECHNAGVRFVVIVGDNVAQTGRVTLRDMASGEQREMPLEGLGG